MARQMSHILLVVLFGCSYYCAAQTITLKNADGFSVVLTPTGASIQKLLVPKCKSKGLVDVALGYDNVTGYATPPLPSFGATVGRVANRISGAKFTLDGVNYPLEANDGADTIHGGAVRWSVQTWKAHVGSDNLTAIFTRTSPDGESGFPGTVEAMVVYSIPKHGKWLDITMNATTDKATPINIVNHNYFNLKGAGSGTILDHVVYIPAAYFTPAPDGQMPPTVLPTGQVFHVRGTPYDFTRPVPIRAKYKKANGGGHSGYDTNYIVPQTDGDQQPVWWLQGVNPQVGAAAATAPLHTGAVVHEPITGMRLKMLTNAPGMQFYTSNALEGNLSSQSVPGKGGVFYPRYGGFCLEGQAFPNSINTPGFPSSVLRPGEVYTNRVRYAFDCCMHPHKCT